jgi:hypothetical protein
MVKNEDEVSPGRYMGRGVSEAICELVPFPEAAVPLPEMAVTLPELAVTFPGNAAGEAADPGIVGSIVAAPGNRVPPPF